MFQPYISDDRDERTAHSGAQQVTAPLLPGVFGPPPGVLPMQLRQWAVEQAARIAHPGTVTEQLLVEAEKLVSYVQRGVETRS